MANVMIGIALAALIGWAAWRTVRRAKKGGGCCGEHEACERRSAVADRDKRRYPYALTLSIGGMTCENCARRVENALNGQTGTWASVRIDTHKAIVRCKAAPDEAALREAVRQAGYVASSFQVLTK